MPEGMELLGAAVAGDQIHAIWESDVPDLRRRGRGRGRPTAPARSSRGTRLQTFYVDGTLVHRRRLHDASSRDSQVVERRSLPAR